MPTDDAYRTFCRTMPVSCAYFQIVANEDNQPIDSVFLEISDAFESLTGVTRAHAVGKAVREVMPGVIQDDVDWVGVCGRVALTGEPRRFESYSKSLGKWFSVSASSPERGYCVAVFEDITARKRAEEASGRSRDALGSIMDSLNAIVYVADFETHEILYTNKYTESVFGDVTGRRCYESLQVGQTGRCDFCTNDRLVDPDGRPTGVYEWEFKNTTNGRWYEIRDVAIEWTNGRLVRIEVALDITERKAMEEQLRTASVTDHLTGLPNRRGFFLIAENEFKAAQRHNRRVSLLYVDIDDFKSINDRLGHAAGDRALIDAASVLKQALREADIVGRIGGDEFAVMITEASETDVERVILSHIQNSLDVRNQERGGNQALAISVGTAHYNPLLPCSLAAMLAEADASMYADKNRRRMERESRASPRTLVS